MRSRIFSLLLVAALPAKAQDYPYDEPPSALPKATTVTTADPNELPVEKPAAALRKNTPVTGIDKDSDGTAPVIGRKRVPALTRFGVKSGLNFAILNSSTAGNFSGIGVEFLGSIGWDLAYQPLFFEFETGYRNHFMGDNPVHIIPLKFGIFYRERLSARNLWKPGLSTSLDLRIESVKNESDFAILPGIHFSSIWEFGPIIVEPLVSIYRIQSSLMSLAFSLRGGYRF